MQKRKINIIVLVCYLMIVSCVNDRSGNHIHRNFWTSAADTVDLDYDGYWKLGTLSEFAFDSISYYPFEFSMSLEKGI